MKAWISASAIRKKRGEKGRIREGKRVRRKQGEKVKKNWLSYFCSTGQGNTVRMGIGSGGNGEGYDALEAGLGCLKAAVDVDGDVDMDIDIDTGIDGH